MQNLIGTGMYHNSRYNTKVVFYKVDSGMTFFGVFGKAMGLYCRDISYGPVQRLPFGFNIKFVSGPKPYRRLSTDFSALIKSPDKPRNSVRNLFVCLLFNVFF